MFQVAANLPGVELNGNVTDHTGRPGVEVSITTGTRGTGSSSTPLRRRSSRTNIVLVGSDANVTSVEGAIAGPGPGEQTLGYTVYDEWGVVNAIGERP